MTRVENTFNGSVIYTDDAAGRRSEMTKSGTMMAQDDRVFYAYNHHSEVTNAVAEVDTAYAYDFSFDEIGNRLTATERGSNTVYAANSLNQYIAIGDFVPEFDADGNQTLIQTSTGIWQVEYNGENRPVLWTQGGKRIEMIYDRLGRRVSYKSLTGNTVTRHNKFLYKGYLCVQELKAASPWGIHREFVWDPTESVATRPLQFRMPDKQTNHFYMFDGNKNVSE